MIKKLLIANRGEIAVRIIRAARELGVRTVAVFSDADAEQMHVALADDSISLGASEPRESYLNAEKLVTAARSAKCDAVHPGYGFLSESAAFSQTCADAGLTFVGPSAASMRKLGSKIEAKKLAVSVGVPITPGFFEPEATTEELRDAAFKLGFPLMLKASAGGGGRGMRVVRDSSQFDDELAIASDEALKAFGNGQMMLEKLIERPRHIEVQVLADLHGNVACLFERECSIQRRHQKLLEESPAVVMTDELWTRMRAAVESLVRASGYTNAGTVEFMFDEETGEFFFLEVNARLQVEHPVTEMITGVDLVQWQIRIASGETLHLPDPVAAAHRTSIQGHAIEARVVAESPEVGFRPSAGRIVSWAEPKLPGIRVDTGYGAGAEIPRHYDSLLAKVIAHGETRADAIQRLRSALLDFHVLGVSTNIGYLLDILEHPQFASGNYDTGFITRNLGEWTPDLGIPAELAAIVENAEAALPGSSVREPGVWDMTDGFRVSP